MVKALENVTFCKVDYPYSFFLKIYSSGGTKTIHKVSAASIVKNCRPRTSLTAPVILIKNHFLDYKLEDQADLNARFS